MLDNVLEHEPKVKDKYLNMIVLEGIQKQQRDKDFS